MENTRADELRGPLFADTPELGDLGGDPRRLRCKNRAQLKGVKAS